MAPHALRDPRSIAALVLTAAVALLSQGESCGGDDNPCPKSDYPLYCPHNGGCCPADSPYSCTSNATGKDVCFTTPFPAGYCRNAQDYCSVGGSDSGPSNGYAQCANFPQAPLYCDTYVGPQLLDSVPGECCSIGTGATSQVGYLCVYGNTTSSGGVCQDMATISAGCPSNGTVVRCCYGGPC